MENKSEEKKKRKPTAKESGKAYEESEPFTPVFDVIVKEYGTSAALVYGVIFRNCLKYKGYCKMSSEHMAELVGLERRTVKRYADLLIENGYLVSSGTEKTGRWEVNTYRYTGKVTFDGPQETGFSHATKAEERAEEAEHMDWCKRAYELVTTGRDKDEKLFNEWRDGFTDFFVRTMPTGTPPGIFTNRPNNGIRFWANMYQRHQAGEI